MAGTDWVAMGIWMAFLVLLVLVIWWVIIRWTTTRDSVPSARADGGGERPVAREILDESLARGEITLDEYERRRRAIERTPPV